MIILLYLILFLSAPMALCFSVVGLTVNPSNWRRYLPGYIYFFFIGAYVYMPIATSNNDLPRYLEKIAQSGEMTIPQVIKYFDDGLFAENLFFWLIGRLGIPHFAPAFTTAVIYLIASYITCDTAERYHSVSSIKYVLLIQTMMLPYASIINNIRNVFAFSLIILAAYLDLVKGKRNGFVLLLYGIGCLMHLSAIVFIVMRLICNRFQKFFWIVMLIPFFFSSAILFIYEHRSSFSFGGVVGNGIQKMINKMYVYLTDADSKYAILARNSISHRVNRLIMMIGVLLLGILIYYYITEIQKKNKQMNIRVSGKQYNFAKLLGIQSESADIYMFIGLIAVMTLSCNAFAIPNYWRFAAAFYVASGVIFVPCIKNYNALPFIYKLVLIASVCISGPGLFIQIWRAHSSVDFITWGRNIVFQNIYTILWDLLIK